MPSLNQPIVIPLPVDGYLPDQPVMAVPPTALIDAQNWIYRDGMLTLRPGLVAYGQDVNQRPLNVSQYIHSDGAIRTVLATDDGWWKYNLSTQAWVDISGTALTSSPTQPTVFRVFYKDTPLKTYLVGTNGVDTMKKWDGDASTYSDASGTPPKAVCIAVAANRMILANLTSGSNASSIAVDVSSLNNFEAGWGATLTAFLADTPGPIVSMLEMGALTTVIYKTDAIYNMVAISDIFPFRFELKQSGVIGPAGVLAVTPITTGVQAYLALDGSLKQWDGVNVKDMGRKFQKYISEHVDFPSIGRSRVVYEPTRNELWVIFPQGGTVDNNIGLVANLNNGSMWPLKYDAHTLSMLAAISTGTGPTIDQLSGTIDSQTKTIDEYAGYVPSIIAGEPGGKIYQLIGAFDEVDTNKITHLFETGVNPLNGDLASFKTIHEVDHYFKKAGGSTTVDTQLGVVAYGEQRLMSAKVAVDVGDDGPYQPTFRLTGRMFSLRVSGSSNQGLEWEGAAAHMSVRGKR